MLPDDLGLFFVLWLLVLLIVTTGSSVGSLFGAYFVDSGIAFLYMPVLIIGWMLFAGFFSRNLPIWLNWLVYLSPFNYGLDAALQLVFTENVVIQCTTNNHSLFEGCNQGLVTNFTGLDVIANGDITVDFPIWVNLSALFLTITLFSTLAYMNLRFLNRPNNLITRTKQKASNISWKQYISLKKNLTYRCSKRRIYKTQV